MELQIVVGNLFCYECKQTFSNSNSFKNHQHRIRRRRHYSHRQSDSSEEEEDEENEQFDSEDSYSPPTKVYGTRSKKRIKAQPSKGGKAKTKYHDENLGRKSPAGKREKVKSTSTSTSTSVLRPPLKSINVQKYKDYIHCYKCFSTFYHLDDLALHFDKCTVPPSNSSFKDFKSNQGDKATTDKNLSISASPKKQAKKGQVKEIVSEISSSSPTTELKPKPTEDLSQNAQNSPKPDSQQPEQQPSNISSTSEQKIPIKSEPEFFPDAIDDLDLEDQSMNSPIGNDVDSSSDGDGEEEDQIQESKSRSKSKKGGKPQDGSEKRFECKICGKGFPMRWKLTRHLTTFVHNRSYPCPITPCTFSDAQEKLLWRHVQTGHPEEYKEKYAQKFPCTEPNCNAAFPIETLLRRHVGSHNRHRSRIPIERSEESGAGPGSGDRTFLCPICGKTLSSQMSLNRHLLTHEENRERSFKCDYPDCGKTFLFKKGLGEHAISHDANKMAPCTYPGCTKSFSRSHLLQYHINAVHLGLKPFKCEECDQTFSTRSNRQKHFEGQHGERKFKCEVENCGKAYVSAKQLKYHSIVHCEGEKEFKCPIPGCSGEFLRQQFLDSHIKVIHEGIKKYLCSYCGKSFGASSTYRFHLRTHTKEKPYVCQFCGWAFITGTMLKNHMRTHTGERPKKCRYCDKTFRVSGNLARHEQIHTGHMPYTCKFCDKAFPDNRPLKKHVQSVHSEEYEFDLGNPITYQSTPGHGGYSAPTEAKVNNFSASSSNTVGFETGDFSI